MTTETLESANNLMADISEVTTMLSFLPELEGDASADAVIKGFTTVAQGIGNIKNEGANSSIQAQINECYTNMRLRLLNSLDDLQAAFDALSCGGLEGSGEGEL